ncbi:M24 family metallopeptidase [Aerococcus urinae]|uniref:Aminopeptidase P family protein n=1 Tax=Aerococcus urinae TaxID=1376 RepID=A0A0X8FDH0_9LACT|nr:Xaa-Pro peptidase family protein [Aerococcus urinae]AMB95330.1 Xaa-Pro aminopeptidase [Aerococcus urinae]MCY3032055.1 Xaa-Pro peptidase family protein [Aerococcus urinae]MCY3036953.1 Xaa-Pro peptidase family protein [Aerococcus urinae]MCY3044101.1 Xaa-Pro peptidase family protein [Aerococcus urinae]MCY3047557.1 Xaa-Pro peptidase family protein [Aerococcus urinae]
MTNHSYRRLDILQDNIKSQGISRLIISDPYAISYYYNIEFDPNERFWLMIAQADQEPVLIANELFVFEEPDKGQVVWIKDGDSIVEAFEKTQVFKELAEGAKVGVDKHLIAGWLLPLMEAYPAFNWLLTSDIVDQQRAIKSEAEMETMREVSAITDRAMKRVIEEVIPYGYSEIEACEQLKKIFVEEGANQGLSFEPIIAYGPNGADPHHVPDHSKPELGDSVVIDIGCRHNYYCSDMTRTVYYGQPSEEALKIHQIVEEAQARGIKAAQVGEALAEVDLAGRNHIDQAGYGPYFTHRIGHFIGRECHEKGDVSKVNQTPIQAGNIFSVEPGIYLTGNTAVRIEDLVIAHEDGPEVINHYPRQAQILDPR